MEETHRARYAERGRAAVPSEYANVPKSPCIHQPRSSLIPSPFGFFIRRHHYLGMID